MTPLKLKTSCAVILIFCCEKKRATQRAALIGGLKLLPIKIRWRIPFQRKCELYWKIVFQEKQRKKDWLMPPCNQKNLKALVLIAFVRKTVKSWSSQLLLMKLIRADFEFGKK